MSPRAIVIRAAGTNCDGEMVRGFDAAGARTDLVHLDRLIERPDRLAGYDLVGFAGGFSYGDDCGAGRVQAVRIRERLTGPLRAMVARGVPMIGACNGFQVLVQTGLLPGEPAADDAGPERGFDPSMQTTALAANAGGRFIDDWVCVEYDAASACVWTNGLANALPEAARVLPIAHGEGRFVALTDQVLRGLESRGQVAVRYASDVNGSMGRVAGICDPSGRVFGLMPHPERFLTWHRHPSWTRLDPALLATVTPGLRMFRNAVESVRRAPVGAG